MTTETAYVAAGCFWGVQYCFDQLHGVLETTAGYMGGTTDQPTYPDVCQGTTGHAEAVKICFDPQIISFDELLQIFWDCHDPTQVNRQGPDKGSQYRSAIFYCDAQQKKIAEQNKAQKNKDQTYPLPIATEISLAKTFFPAEDYHQKYLINHPNAACHIPSVRPTTKRSRPE
jgi:peptide-methionine (S)-S-oxide reductase